MTSVARVKVAWRHLETSEDKPELFYTTDRVQQVSLKMAKDSENDSRRQRGSKSDKTPEDARRRLKTSEVVDDSS